MLLRGHSTYHLGFECIFVWRSFLIFPSGWIRKRLIAQWGVQSFECTFIFVRSICRLFLGSMHVAGSN